MSNDNVISSVGEAPHVRGVDSGLDSIGRGNATPIDGNEVILTVDIPHGDSNIISSPGWSPRRND